MSRLVSKETLVSEARVRRSKSSHAQELEHFSAPFSPQAWLGLVEERRVQWSKTHVPWRSEVAVMIMMILKSDVFMVWGRGIYMNYCCVSIFDMEMVGVGV